jgi:lysophospholipase L1-like esterase
MRRAYREVVMTPQADEHKKERWSQRGSRGTASLANDARRGTALALFGLALVCSAGMAAEELLFDFEKAGDRQGWDEPAEQYRAEYGLLTEPQQSGKRSVTGAGALQVTLDTSLAGSPAKRRGRIDRYYGGKADWSSFGEVAGMVYVPEGAPGVNALLAIQSGSAWKWAQGSPVRCPGGKWTRIALDLRPLEDMDQVQMLYFVAQCPNGDFRGTIYLDRVMLEGGSGRPLRRTASEPGTEPSSTPGIGVETFDTAEGWDSQDGARVQVAENARVGSGALAFDLPGMCVKKLKPIAPRVPDVLDEGYAGVSFWVKGDGSDNYGTVVLCGQHPQWFPFKYATSFPLRDTEWHRIVVPWYDWIPEDPVFAVGEPGGAAPSNFQYLRVGNKWKITHNNAKLPPFHFSMDHMQLETEVPAVEPPPALPALGDVCARLAAREPVRIVCMGDSITAGTSLANPDEERYAQVLERLLRERLGYEGVTVESRAVGGAQGNDLRLWVQRDFEATPPDVVTVMYGYNDKTWAYPSDYYGYVLADYVDRIARQTDGSTAVLLMTPIPGRGPRFVMMDDYAEAVRAVAAKRGLALCDVHEVFKALGRTSLNAYFADQAHPNARGQVLLAETLANVLAAP